MKRFIAAFLTFALTLTLVTFVSAAEVPTLHPAETLKVACPNSKSKLQFKPQKKT